MEYHRLDLVEQGVASFEGLDECASECFLTINLQHNRLVNFEHFGTHPHLTELQLQHNAIESFQGLTKQASLRVLCLQGCPIAAHPYYRLMALLTIGLTVELVDGLPVTSHERHVARSLGKRAALAVSCGWLLDLRPRTSDDYEALITEHKRLRRDARHRCQGQSCASVKSVLAELSKGRQARGDDGTAAAQLQERERTITRLARRVAQLEGQLTASSEGYVVPMLAPNQLEVVAAQGTSSNNLFSAAELAQVDTVCFSRGVQLRHNLALTPGDLRRVCVLLDHATITVQNFLSCETLVQLPLRSLRVRHLPPLTLVLEDEVGGALGLVLETLPLLHTVYKAVFVLSSRPVPPLSAMTQRQLQDLAKAAQRAPITKAAAAPPPPLTFSRPTTRAESRTSSFMEDLPSEDGRVDAASSTGEVQPPRSLNVAASPASEKLDNVEDVPPLPNAFSRLSTAGGADSIVFSVEGQRSAAAADAATSSAVLKSNSDIDFLSVKGSQEANAAAAKPAAPPSVPVAPKSKLFANLMLNSSTSSDSVVFQSDGAKSDKEDSAAVEAAKGRQASATPPPVPLSKAPMAPRPAVPVPPRPPPQRKSQQGTPAASLPPSATARSAAATPGPPRPPPSTRSRERASLSSSVVRDDKQLSGVGEQSITFRVADGGEEDKVSNASKASAPPRVPTRFSALKVDSDSD